MPRLLQDARIACRLMETSRQRRSLPELRIGSKALDLGLAELPEAPSGDRRWSNVSQVNESRSSSIVYASLAGFNHDWCVLVGKWLSQCNHAVPIPKLLQDGKSRLAHSQDTTRTSSFHAPIRRATSLLTAATMRVTHSPGLPKRWNCNHPDNYMSTYFPYS